MLKINSLSGLVIPIDLNPLLSLIGWDARARASIEGNPTISRLSLTSDNHMNCHIQWSEFDT